MPIFLWKLIEGENIMGAIYGWQYGNTCLDTKRLRYVIYYTYSNHNFTKMLCTQWSLTFRLHVVDSILAICRYNFTPKCCVHITLPRVICKWWSNQLLTKISLGCSSRLPSLFNQHAMHDGVIQHVHGRCEDCHRHGPHALSLQSLSRRRAWCPYNQGQDIMHNWRGWRALGRRYILL